MRAQTGSRRLHRRLAEIAVAAAAAAGTFVAAPAAVADTAPSPGVVVSGDGLVARGDSALGDMVIDAAGREHLLTAVHRKGHRQLTYRYGVKRRAAGDFTLHHVHLHTSKQHPRVETLLSTSGRQVDAIIASCTGVWTSHAAVSRHTLPALTRAVHGPSSCGEDTSLNLDNAVALPHGRIALLVDPNTGRGGQFEVYVGRAGHAFHRADSQPQFPDGVEALRLARDPVTGTRYIAYTHGVQTSPGRTGVQVGVVEQQPGGDWTSPADVASVSDDYGHRLDVAAADGDVVVAVSKNAVAVSDPTPGTLLVERTADGGWQPAQAPDSTQPNDVNAHVTFRSDGTLGLAFARCSTDHPGDLSYARGTAYTETRTDGTWSAATAKSKPVNLTIDFTVFDRSGDPVVGFRRHGSALPINDRACVVTTG